METGIGRWEPEDLDSFLADYVAGYTDFELSQRHGTTVDRVKWCLRRLRAKGVIADRRGLKTGSGKTVEERFVDFLRDRARTVEEIEDRFGDDAEWLLESEFEQFQLFRQLDMRGELRYILLRKPECYTTPPGRVWRYHQSTVELPGGDSVPQGYMLVEFPDELLRESGRIDIVPLFDVHYGHVAFKRQKFADYIEYIRSTPNVFTFVGGDLLENALDDNKGKVYDQSIPPGKQVEQMAHILAGVAHKCLFIMPGNHEWRTYRKAGIDPARVIASLVGIPYVEGPLYMSMVCCGHKWKAYISHGRTGSSTKGGKINAASRPRAYTDFVHWYVSGHVHDPMLFNDTCIVEDPVHCRLSYMAQWTVVCPSFLSYEGTYAYRSGFPPPGHGGVRLSIFPDGSYLAALVDAQSGS